MSRADLVLVEAEAVAMESVSQSIRWTVVVVVVVEEEEEEVVA